jgi:AICAR transformylase/IMP cyclohydrolase PurH
MRRLAVPRALDGSLIRSVAGGVLVQSVDLEPEIDWETRVVTERRPTAAELPVQQAQQRSAEEIRESAASGAARPGLELLGAHSQPRAISAR